jgi:hypothetical protein
MGATTTSQFNLKITQFAKTRTANDLSTPFLRVTSCNIDFTFLSHHTTFEVVIDKTKSHIESRVMRNNSC